MSAQSIMTMSSRPYLLIYNWGVMTGIDGGSTGYVKQIICDLIVALKYRLSRPVATGVRKFIAENSIQYFC